MQSSKLTARALNDGKKMSTEESAVEGADAPVTSKTTARLGRPNALEYFSGTAIAAAGFLLMVTWKSPRSLPELVDLYGVPIFAALLVLGGSVLAVRTQLKRLFRTEVRFSDVDERSRAASRNSFEELLARLSKPPFSPSDYVTVKGAQIDFKKVQESLASTSSPIAARDFVSYFDSIRKLLEEKASVADEKASILLDKGTLYSRMGIGFFITSIVAWQLAAAFYGFKVQFIYGIVSTSLLFVFIEFLSAWFLKQYRQFIDTSTYLVKVKSIFDRYMLVYLATKEAVANGHDQKKSHQELVNLLKAEISWPDTYLTKNPDVSFAKETLETMSLLMKSMKSEVKEVGSKEGGSSRGKRAPRNAHAQDSV